MERRTLLRNIALGVAAGPAAGIVGTLALNADQRALGALADAPTAGRYTEATAPTVFVQGTVISRDARGILLSNRNGTQSLRLSAVTSVWRETETTAEAIASGDFLYVQGRRRQAENSENQATQHADVPIEALRIWANIGWYRGQVSAVEADHIRLFLGNGERTIYFSPITALFRGGLTSERFTGQLVVGQKVEALGMFVPGGDMRATRVWVT